MEKFDERKKSFEKKFAHDEELKFKVASRRNKYLGQWASQKLGYDENKEKEYIKSVIKADFQEAGDEDVFRKIQVDLKGHNISDDEIRNKMKEFKISARRNKYLGEWGSKIMGYSEEQTKEYIQSVIKADFAEAGDEDVFRKIKSDLESFNVSDDEIRSKMNEMNEKAKEDFN